VYVTTKKLTICFFIICGVISSCAGKSTDFGVLSDNSSKLSQKNVLKDDLLGYERCYGYTKFFKSKCYRESIINDTYPYRAYEICLDFMKKYNNSWRVLSVGRCLVNAEANCQKFENCSLRNKCRFNADWWIN